MLTQMPRYKFVEVETRSGKPSKPSSSVRSHAIRAGLRKSVNPPKTKADLTSPKDETVEYKSSDSRSVLDVSTENSIWPPTYHIESVCAGRADPFDSLPIPSNLEIDYLVKYLITKYDAKSTSPDRRRLWFPYALQSAPMMHGTLAMAAAIWRAECPVLKRSIQIEGLRQKGEAMRLVRARLAQVDSVADGKGFTFVMSTMSTLVLVEALDGNFKAAETHLRGVHILFNSRGGRDGFKDERIFYKSTNLADIQVAIALGRRLIFPHLWPDQIYISASIAGLPQSPPFDRTITDESSYECVAIFIHLRQLIIARQLPKVSSKAQRIPPNVVDELILIYLYRDCVDDVSDSRIRSRALVLAAQLFMYVTLRQVPPKSPLIRRMCMRLQDAVGISLTGRQNWAEDDAALLWIAFVGILGTGERAETCPAGQSFLHIFRSVIRGYPRSLPQGIGSLHKILTSFLWHESSCRPLLAWLEDCQLTGQA